MDVSLKVLLTLSRAGTLRCEHETGAGRRCMNPILGGQTWTWDENGLPLLGYYECEHITTGFCSTHRRLAGLPQ